MFFWHVSNNYLSIIRKTVQATLRYFIMHLYKQSSCWHDVFDTHTHHVENYTSYFNAWFNTIKLLVQTSWRWTRSFSKHVENNIIDLNHSWKKCASCWFFLHMNGWMLYFSNVDCWTECWRKKFIDGFITNSLQVFTLKLKGVTGEILCEGNHEMFRK